MDLFSFYLPTRVTVNQSCEIALITAAQAFGKRLLFVVDQQLMQYAENSISSLKNEGIDVEVLAFDNPEPTCEFIDDVTETLKRKEMVNGIVGFGGGSAIDLAKALSISITHDQPIWLYANLSNRPPLPFTEELLPVIAIPTTAGTGSEVTPYAVLTNTKTQQKGTVQDPLIFPKEAILDPKLHQSMPLHITASTGIDAFAHAIESYINISKASPVSEWAAEESIALIFNYLSETYQNPNNLEARAKMAWASTLAGFSISHRGTTVAHAIAEPLGALVHIPHGLGVSICTLPVLRQSLPKITGKLSALFQRVFNQNLGSDLENATQFLNELDNLLVLLGLNQSVSNIVDSLEDNFSKILLNNILEYKFRPLKQHPVEFSEADLGKIVEEVVYG